MNFDAGSYTNEEIEQILQSLTEEKNKRIEKPIRESFDKFRYSLLALLKQGVEINFSDDIYSFTLTPGFEATVSIQKPNLEFSTTEEVDKINSIPIYNESKIRAFLRDVMPYIVTCGRCPIQSFCSLSMEDKSFSSSEDCIQHIMDWFTR